MNFFSPMVAMMAVFTHEIVSSESLVIVSNFMLVIATFVLVFVTVREAHKTVRDVVKSDNRLLAKLLGPLLVKPEPGAHKRVKDEN